MKLLGRTKSKLTKDEDHENMLHLEITEVLLVHCNIGYNNYQQDSRVLHIFITNRSFGQLTDISPKYFLCLKTLNLEFPYIEVYFTDQNTKPLEIEDKINITLSISIKYLSFAQCIGKNIGENISKKFLKKLMNWD